MKRWKKVVIIIAIIIVVIGIIVFAISKVNTETFEEKMIKKGFKITNINNYHIYLYNKFI